MERQIGEKFTQKGHTLEVVEGKKDSCEGCYFDRKWPFSCNYRKIVKKIGHCGRYKRTDRKDVIFKKV